MKITINYPINPDVFKTVVELGKNYEVVASYCIDENSESLSLKDYKETRTCRFCGKLYQPDKFNMKAHGIPHFTGNNKLFLDYECNSCNSYFSEFESEMGNFMQADHAISGIKGKKKRPPKLIQKGKINIESNDDSILISNVPSSSFKDFTNRREIGIDRPTYIPEYVYRCLVKIAISIIPESKLGSYQETIEWLRDKNSVSNIIPKMVYNQFPSSIQSRKITVKFFEKMDSSDLNSISSIFFLSYANFSFQTYLPFSNKEHSGVQLQAFPFIIPSDLDLDERFKHKRRERIIDLSSKEKVSNEVISYTINGDVQ